MILADVNVLLYAARAEAPRHEEYRLWMRRLLRSADGLALTMTTAAGFVRIATDPRVYRVPATAAAAAAVVSAWSGATGTRWLDQTGPVWEQLVALMAADPGIVGKLVPDAVLAATAIAHGVTLATDDRGFRRYPGLRVMHPLDG